MAGLNFYVLGLIILWGIGTFAVNCGPGLINFVRSLFRKLLRRLLRLVTFGRKQPQP